MQFLLCRKVPAEDGVNLATDVYLPDGKGHLPTIIVRTPYHLVGLQGTARQFTTRGYAFVTQDCRGKYDSDGVFTPLVHEAADGQAAIDWAANQKWCNGRIGLWGRSYLGIVQVPAASGGHEALRCIAPSVAPGSFFRDWLRYDGCFALGNAIRWSLTHATCRNQPPLNHFTWDELNRLPNPDAIADRVGFDTPALSEWANRDRYDEYWEQIDQCLMHEQIKVPGFHVGGWFDHLTRGQFDAYQNIRDRGATELARSGQRLLIGPWGHTNTGNIGPNHCRYGDWDFGAEADLPVLAHELQFLDFYLKDQDNGYTKQPPVKLFLMGENRWLHLTDWPPPDAVAQSWYLSSDGSANMSIGDGRLTLETPDTNAADGYEYDPQNPVPTRGGPIYWGNEFLGPVDQRPLLDRPDVLYYRSPKLASPLTVVGEITLRLFVESSAVDTDFIAKLCVEEASGAVTCLTLGSLRCRYRESWSEPQPLKTGEPTAIRLQMGHIAYVFPAGSRVCLLITSSDFPRILPHPNTLAPPWAESNSVLARNSVLHGPGTLSLLKLPVIEV
ncbi:MAG: CocE/NonD family hydrolase [Candidatus Poribacteria bacterium]